MRQKREISGREPESPVFNSIVLYPLWYILHENKDCAQAWGEDEGEEKTLRNESWGLQLQQCYLESIALLWEGLTSIRHGKPIRY